MIESLELPKSGFGLSSAGVVSVCVSIRSVCALAAARCAINCSRDTCTGESDANAQPLGY